VRMGPNATISVDVLALANDPDGPPSGLRIELVTTSSNLVGGTGGTIAAALSSDGRQVTVTSGNPANGQGEIYFHVTDERGGVSGQAVIRVLVNRPPSAPPGNIPRLYGNNEDCTFTPTVSDPDGNSVTVESPQSNSPDVLVSMADAATINCTVGPAAAPGNVTISYTVTDSLGDSVTGRTTISLSGF
jgi:hypothetical protein